MATRIKWWAGTSATQQEMVAELERMFVAVLKVWTNDCGQAGPYGDRTHLDNLEAVVKGSEIEKCLERALYRWRDE